MFGRAGELTPRSCPHGRAWRLCLMRTGRIADDTVCPGRAGEYVIRSLLKNCGESLDTALAIQLIFIWAVIIL